VIRNSFFIYIPDRPEENFQKMDQSKLNNVMGDGKFCFRSEAVHILIHLIDIISGPMIKAGLIKAVVSPLSHQDKVVRIEGIELAVRMAFDGKVAVDIVMHSSSFDTDDIRGQIDWPECVKFVQDGIKDDNEFVRAFSWLCVESFLSSSKWPSYQSELLMK
jgi:hypothetical protein